MLQACCSNCANYTVILTSVAVTTSSQDSDRDIAAVTNQTLHTAPVHMSWKVLEMSENARGTRPESSQEMFGNVCEVFVLFPCCSFFALDKNT